MIRCYIGIGGNLNDAKATVLSAIKALKQLPDCQWVGVSSLFESIPLTTDNSGEQPKYINAVAAIDTTLDPLALLDATQQIEQQHGRQRTGERWGPRTLDLDILLFGDRIIDHPRLVVPHYGLEQREFVLYPLQQLQPDLVLPNGRSLQQIIEKVPYNGMIEQKI